MKHTVIFLFSFLLIATAVSAKPKINGIDYSPFWIRENPNGLSPTRGHITFDVTKMQPLTKNARIYGIDSAYYVFAVQVCESLSIGYLVSGWTSFQYQVTWAKARADLVKFVKLTDSLGYRHLNGIIYGYDNCADLSGYTEAERIVWIRAEIDTLRKALKSDSVKISHEENWDVWIRYPELADSLDFVSIRIVPQTDLVPIAKAWQYVKDCYAAVKKVFPDKEVKITAVGWATDGSCERDQKIFLDSLTADTVLDYYVCNFADENWKSPPEGSYGIYTIDRQPKLFLYQPPVFNFSGIFPRDSSRLDGVVYNYRAFGYSQYISQPALENDVGRWADTLADIAGTTFFNYSDLLSTNGVIANAFVKNGNKMAILDFQSSDTVIVKNNRVSAVFVDVGGSLYGYGAATAIGRQKCLDNIRHNYVIPIRANSKNDSVFIGATASSDYYFLVDSLIKYPEALQDFDGFLLKIDFYKYQNTASKEAYFDSLMGLVVKALGGKRLAVMLNCTALASDVANANYYKSKDTYAALKKAANKYGFPLVYNDISNLYEPDMSKASVLYKYLQPGKFSSIIALANSKAMGGLSWLDHGDKLIIRNAPRGSVLSLFDLSGRMVKRVEISADVFSIKFNSERLPAGTWIARLEAGGKQFAKKILIER